MGKCIQCHKKLVAAVFKRVEKQRPAHFKCRNCNGSAKYDYTDLNRDWLYRCQNCGHYVRVNPNTNKVITPIAKSPNAPIAQ
jgi:hypothetical protein